MAPPLNSEFVEHVKTSDDFVGCKNLLSSVRFRPDNKCGEFLGFRKGGNLNPVSLWVIGRISPSDIHVKPDGNFYKIFSDKPVDKVVADAAFRFQLIDPEIPDLSPAFSSAFDGLRSIQDTFPGMPHKDLLDSSGGYDKIKLSAKVFDQVHCLPRLLGFDC